ncbi:twin-arginine translocase subunit TatC [Chloracidobacterium validum]|uniref:Sec-independent protein translocase protein TatC n=1 Tax=Chloracidobacterium validum TaxID=2821543 RepID=A0ABX8B6S3_9BACT|nr:twin-arginine translocase subunit TatC [Chloracidobacterium validum]QUW02663.1 twin-arginine translocase subunit TatC [Chloracidobacterium validum]
MADEPLTKPDQPLAEPPEDGEEAGTMGFLDHLDELRRRVFYVVAFVAAAFIVCWGFADAIYSFLSKPVADALRASRLAQVKVPSPLPSLADLPDGAQVTYVFGAGIAIEGVTIPAGTTVPARIVRDAQGRRKLETAQTLVVSQRIVPEGFTLPSAELFATAPDPLGQLVVHTVQGAFNLYIKVAFYAAIFFSIPFALYQLYAFVAPGLYRHERAYIYPVLILGTGFFLLGAAFGYYVAFPQACLFLLGTAKDFQPMIEVNEYFDLIITIVLGLGLVFELPTVVFVLARLGLVTAGFLLRIWRLAVMGILVLAAIISPTSDIPNMMIFAVPMLALYFLSVGIAYVFGRQREADEAVSATDANRELRSVS